MANQFASFNQSSALSSISHDPIITLASNCIRDYFGPTIQLVADCIQMRGGESTLSQIINTINTKLSSKMRSSERIRMIKISDHCKPNPMGTPSTSAIRASLLVLIQHSIVTYTKTISRSGSRCKTIYRYRYHPERARILLRYSRFVEYTKKGSGDIAATLVEELLLHGRMRTVDAVEATVDQLKQQKSTPKSDRYTYREKVLGSFRRLVSGGFVKEVEDVKIIDDDDEEEGEREFHENSSLPQRVESDYTDDPATISLLQNGQYKSLPPGAVWSINVEMFHDSMRAISLGTLVVEMYGHKVQYSGQIVAAALRVAAYKEHVEGDTDFESKSLFTTECIQRYIPKPVLQDLEKRSGGVTKNLYKALIELEKFNKPQVVREMEVADGHPGKAKFQISTQNLVQFMQERVSNQIVLDSHGQLAARIYTILKTKGILESDAIAEAAMVPAKDTRELLHRLYRENYINLFNLNPGKQHNPANMFYLWSVSKPKLLAKITDNVCTALYHMRLRRQHEVEVGKEWIERQEAGDIDENENETDKVNFTQFCKGMERLDKASVQLDETLMVLKDY